MPLDSIRLPSPKNYTELTRKGRRFKCGEMDLRVMVPAPDGKPRMAVRLKSKNGSAPFRNRVRRQLRELLRATRDSMTPAWILWSFPSARMKRSTKELREDAKSCLTLSGILTS
jgi:ribonuclease P protein component